ncbi:hypothetical protein [Armatimonas sp.]|uniref:hypothetical protein n=1 Tax=Armatimonas sp. TaxID=1872638 RepID=UPI00286A11AE|nr:hypothetical protein [Armatimonas sp.]
MSESFGVAGALGLGSSENDYLQLLYLLNYPRVALPIFQSWLHSPFLSTQLYGLLGLHELDPAAFRRGASRYARNTTPIHQVQKQLQAKSEVERLYALLGLQKLAVAPSPQPTIATSYEVCFELRGCLLEVTTPARVRERIEAGVYDKSVQYDLRRPR